MIKRNAQFGFTLVELLVTIGIFTMLTDVVLGKYRTFDTNAKFANASEDVVLALRQAQVYGVGVKGASGCPGDAFVCPYGVHFSNGANGLVVFADTNTLLPNGFLDIGETIGLESLAANWGSAISIDSLSCGQTGIPCTNGVSITFKRPSPDANITDGAFSSYDRATINIKDSNTGKTSAVTITKAGQISLQ